MQRRLAASKAERPRILRQQADYLLCPAEQPGVLPVLRSLGAHEAVVVTLLGEQQAVVPCGVLPQHRDPAAVVGDVDDVAGVEVRQLGSEPEHRPARLGLGFGHEVQAVSGRCCLPIPQQAREGLGGAIVLCSCVPGQADAPYIVGQRPIQPACVGTAYQLKQGHPLTAPTATSGHGNRVRRASSAAAGRRGPCFAGRTPTAPYAR